MSENQGFIGALFDMSFTQFVTTKLIKLLFMISIGISGLVALGVLFYGLTSGGFMAVVGIIVAPVLFLLYVLGARIWLELVIVVFRIAENTAEIARQGRPAGM